MLPGLAVRAGMMDPVIEVVLTSTTNVSIQALFSASDWLAAIKKRVVVPAGVTIGSTGAATPAIRSGTARGGDLEVVVGGTINGAGGAANSGIGGTAFKAEQDCALINTGTIQSGGGGGGVGGTGGAGLTTTTEGPTFVYTPSAFPWYGWAVNSGASTWAMYWAYSGGAAQASGSGALPASVVIGAYTYYPGAYQGNDGPVAKYAIYRQTATPSSGGAGGAGGRGQGHDGAAASGTPGSAGGTNAGAGGTGGTGGAYGTNGSTGSTGSSGNSGSGSAGTAGGLAGYAIEGNAFVTLTNSGTISGRQG